MHVDVHEPTFAIYGRDGRAHGGPRLHSKNPQYSRVATWLWVCGDVNCFCVCVLKRSSSVRVSVWRLGEPTGYAYASREQEHIQSSLVQELAIQDELHSEPQPSRLLPAPQPPHAR